MSFEAGGVLEEREGWVSKVMEMDRGGRWRREEGVLTW